MVADGGGSGSTGRAVAARSAWSLVGQGLSSSSNFILTVLVLAQGTATQFATLSVVLTIYTFFLLLLRAGVGLPVTLLYSFDLAAGRDGDLRAAAGVTAAMSAVASSTMLVGALVAPGDRGQWIVLGALLPLLLLQDTARYTCFARGRPRAAAEADGLWVLLQLVGSAAVWLAVPAGSSAVAFVAVWAGAGAVSGCFLLARTALRPGLGAGWRWIVAHRGLAGRLVTDYLAGAGSHYATYLALAVVAGAGELGRLKAAQTFLGPLIVVLLGGAVFGVPESVRAGNDPARLRQLTLRLSGALVGASVLCGTLVYLSLIHI